MMPYVYLAVITTGQLCPPPPTCQPPVYVDMVTDYVYIQNITERYRTYERVSYGGEWRRVPVINGYVPEVTWSRRGDGGFNIYYNYSNRIPLQECNVWGMETERPSRQRSREPERQDRKSTRLNSSHTDISRMPSSA